ncbi:MAG: HAD family hydrolase [archaeon]
MKKELICLDLDNTLVYSDRVHVAAFHKAFRKNGLPKVSSKRIISLFGLVGRVLVRDIFPELSDKQVEKVVVDHDRFVVGDTVQYVRVIRGAKHTLKLLKKKYALVLISNTKHKEMVATLRAAGIEKSTFRFLIGNDEVKHPKPASDALKLAMKKTKIKNGYMVGDTVYDIRAGKGAGLKVIAVLTGNHSRAKLKKEKPDYILKSVAELHGLLG